MQGAKRGRLALAFAVLAFAAFTSRAAHQHNMHSTARRGLISKPVFGHCRVTKKNG